VHGATTGFVHGQFGRAQHARRQPPNRTSAAKAKAKPKAKPKPKPKPKSKPAASKPALKKRGNHEAEDGSQWLTGNEAGAAAPEASEDDKPVAKGTLRNVPPRVSVGLIKSFRTIAAEFNNMADLMAGVIREAA